MNPTNGGWLIALSVLIALLLTAVHLPETWPQWLGWGRPAWMLLVIFFWVLEVPHRIGLISVWLVGCLLDVLYADPLGLNGLLLAVATYLTWRFYERWRMYSVIQQCALVFALVVVLEFVRVFVQDALFDRGLSWGPFAVAMVSAILWPFTYLILLRLRQQFRVE